MAELLY